MKRRLMKLKEIYNNVPYAQPATAGNLTIQKEANQNTEHWKFLNNSYRNQVYFYFL